MSENFFEKLSAEGSQFTKDDIGLLLLHYLFSDKEKVRKTAQILFMEQAPELKKDIEEILIGKVLILLIITVPPLC